MPRPELSVRAAIAPGLPVTNWLILDSLTQGQLDLNTLGDTFIVGQGGWAELVEYVSSVTTRRGRQKQLEQYTAGVTTMVLDNQDRRFDPTWDAGPYIDGAGHSNLTSMRAVHIQATHNGIVYDLAYGFTDNWPPHYEYPEGGTVTVGITDAFKVFSAIDPLEGAAVGTGEATGARLNRILDLASWPTGQRDIDTGNATHQATTMAQPIISQLRLAADSERGDLYMGANGFVTFRERQSRFVAIRSLYVQWVIGDGAGELNPSAFVTSNSDALVRNDVNVARVGGSVITRRDATADLYPYLRKSYNRTDLTLLDDSQVADYADTVLYQFADQRPVIDSVTFEPDGYEDLWPMVLGAMFGDRVQVSVRHPWDGSVWSGQYFIEGISHSFGPMGSKWRTTFSLSDATRWPTHPFRLDLSQLDGTDVL